MENTRYPPGTSVCPFSQHPSPSAGLPLYGPGRFSGFREVGTRSRIPSNARDARWSRRMSGADLILPMPRASRGCPRGKPARPRSPVSAAAAAGGWGCRGWGGGASPGVDKHGVLTSSGMRALGSRDDGQTTRPKVGGVPGSSAAARGVLPSMMPDGRAAQGRPGRGGCIQGGEIVNLWLQVRFTGSELAHH